MTHPTFIYGTAWKEDQTEALVTKALEHGFRAFDTANQRRHYVEVDVGNAISKAMENDIKRDELFIQTKFTSIGGQDHRLPYDANADSQTQVQQSFQSSLDHLNIDYIDSYILHGPSQSIGLSDHDIQVWKEMEYLKNNGKVAHIGVSNFSAKQLKILCKEATVKPAFVQNRCFAAMLWDKDVHLFCKENGMIYQGFSLLTANPIILNKLINLGNKKDKTPAQIVFRFSQQIGMIPLTGTTQDQHMIDALNIDFDLTNDEVAMIETMYFDDIIE